MGRRHAVAVWIEQDPGEQARLPTSRAGAAFGGIVGEPRLSCIPQRLIDDRRVVAGMGYPLMNDLAEIGTVLQHQVERAARKWLAANEAAGSARPRFALDAAGVELLLE